MTSHSERGWPRLTASLGVTSTSGEIGIVAVPSPPPDRGRVQSLGPIVIFDVVVPIVAHFSLSSAGLSWVTALILCGVFPAFGIVLGLVRRAGACTRSGSSKQRRSWGLRTGPGYGDARPPVTPTSWPAPWARSGTTSRTSMPSSRRVT